MPATPQSIDGIIINDREQGGGRAQPHRTGSRQARHRPRGQAGGRQQDQERGGDHAGLPGGAAPLRRELRGGDRGEAAEDIRWHFIGHLQSNKIRKIMVPNLDVIETVDRQSLAEKLNKQLEKEGRKLKVLLQVKTSGEDTKSGADPKQLDSLFLFLRQACPCLEFRGLMTIGAQGDFSAFEQLRELKTRMCAQHGLSAADFELSMGMSGDFEEAIAHHSTSVRVGSSIFGERNYHK